MSDLISITIVIDNDTAFCEEVDFKVPAGTNVATALALFTAAKKIEVDLKNKKVGIFGLATATNTLLAEGDRLEVYQPLKIDPKQARRIRAERAKLKNKSIT